MRKITTAPITNLRSMYQSEAFRSYEGDSDANVARNLSAQTHQDVINLWREFLDTLSVYDPDFDDIEDRCKYDIDMGVHDLISAEIGDVELWHINNGSINNEVAGV
jgi:hypothetical protein